MQLCSAVAQKKDPGIQITKQLVVADISGLGIKKTWQLKGFILDFNRLLTLNYPEILDRVLVLSQQYTSLCSLLHFNGNICY